MTIAGRFRLVGVACAAMLLCGQAQRPLPDRGLSYGTILYQEPAIEDLVPLGTAVVRRDAVLAEQRAEIIGARMINDRAVRVAAPFNHETAAGTVFRRYRTPAGERWCATGIPGVMYTPPEDENGEIYPGRCLVDRDQDGAYEAVRMVPYRPGVAEREMPIAPVRLLTAPPVTDPRISRLHVFQRIRIIEVDQRQAVLVLEHGQMRPGQETTPRYATEPSTRAVLPLRADAAATLGGLSLRIEGGPGAWRVVTSGAFAPWVRLESGAAAVRVGPYYLPERED